ncbi:LytR family transcriptional regulator [Lysinibacillus yapensis]|uniref:LytR family transcriptional regulator n=1 Tax=Ureibacillus yapensis TaxID=2304605 RepID=A0A396SKQ9_9BACL|nr:LCP family protein [Lysinibacillus yapensis]RHW39949.1 LytR family transcriptional regulator [Lysinibacillus yapensis]
MKRSELNNLNKKKKKKFSFVLKVLLVLSASLLLCVTAYGVYITKKAEKAAEQSYEEIGRAGSDLRDAAVKPLEDNVSILFVGIDDSEERAQGSETSRSDALILATLNNEEKTVKLISIPRDSNVYIPYVGYNDKITHAHAYGGTLATIETVEQLFEIPVDYYVRMNFNAFIDVIDALGGIEVDVDIPYAFYEMDENDNKSIYLEPGLQELDGREALSLARTRKHDSDIMRGQRQQDIIEAIAKKAASASSITKYDDVLQAISTNMKTDMTFDEMKSFINYFTEGVPQIDSLTLDGYDDTSTGTYYYQLDTESLEETKHILQAHLELIPDTSDISGTEGQSTSENASGLPYSPEAVSSSR